MKALFWIGVVVLVLGVLSLVVPIPQTHNNGVKIGGAEIGVETRTQEKLSPAISAVLIIVGAGMMVAGKKN